MLTRALLLNRCAELTKVERQQLEKSVSHTNTVKAGQILVRQGHPVSASTLLVEGLMTRHVDARDGRRHLVALHVPGDFVDLHAYVLKKLDHDVAALTDVTVAVLPHAKLAHLQRNNDRLFKHLWFLTLLDASMHRQWIFRLANLSAMQRVAHFLCETNARLLAIGASDGATFALPMTQSDIGAVCGLTNVHVNRVLRGLRERDLCVFRGAKVSIADLRGLATFALFDPAYLFLNEEVALRAQIVEATA